MARLYEHQGKELIREAGIPVPEGGLAKSPEEARAIAERLGKPVVLKAQVWATGRMKAGGIKFASTPEEAEELAKELLGSTIKGMVVEEVLVEEKLPIEAEFYAGIIIDDSYRVKAPVVLFSTEGGVDIEEVAARSPEKIAKAVVDVLEGFGHEDARSMLKSLELPEGILGQAADVLVKLYGVFRSYHASSAEINPLALTRDGRLVALDCRISIDDSSVFLHPELGIRVARESNRPPTELDEIAWKVEESDYRGVFYFMQLASEEEEGCVGFHGIGGGASILAADALVRVGLKLANFTDTSGNPTASKVYRAAKIILSQPNIDGYFLGGACIASQEQWYHAFGLVKAFREELANRPGFPVIILICGNKEEETIRILREGLADLPIRLEVYGSDYLDRVDYLAERMKALVEEYRRERHGGGA
ncbi:MAG TPA: succinyl-CoA synthetase subunit beta [Candidatus Bathyarchaeota archaeon]|nr:succinyl-CoA synthetase subunit beta [Candidatus Bathyarchaeota archaeon]